MLSMSLTACGDDDDDKDITDEHEEYNDNNSGSSTSSDNYSSIINSKVSASVSYSDYFWHITFKTSLTSSDVDGKSIKYGMDCGYTSIDYEYYQVYFDDNTSSTITEDICTFFAAGDSYTKTFVYYQFFAKEYKSLNDRQKNGQSLSQDEKATLERVKKILNESTAKQGVAEFWGQLFVEISGKKYYVKSFGRGTKTN